MLTDMFCLREMVTGRGREEEGSGLDPHLPGGGLDLLRGEVDVSPPVQNHCSFNTLPPESFQFWTSCSPPPRGVHQILEAWWSLGAWLPSSIWDLGLPSPLPLPRGGVRDPRKPKKFSGALGRERCMFKLIFQKESV